MILRKKHKNPKTGLAEIDDAPILHAIAKKIESKATQPAEELSNFDVIESELLKRGSINHENIQWEKVEETTEAMLRNETKDLELLNACVVCAMRRNNFFGFTLALTQTLCFLDNWLASCHPLQPQRRALLLQRICGEFERFDITKHSLAPDKERAYAQASLKLLQSLHEITITHKLEAPGALLQQLETALSKALQAKKTPDKEKGETLKPSKNAPPTTATLLTKATPLTRVDAPGSTDKKKDPRALKKQLSQAADAVFHIDATNALSYELRRFACWHDVTTAPPVNRGNRTALPCINIDTLEEYRTLLSFKTPDNALILKLERALVFLPFWLEGHRLSAEIARHFSRLEASERITKAASAFFSRLPGLQSLCFEDGAPLITQQAGEWLTTKTPSLTETPQKIEFQKAKQLLCSIFDKDMSSPEALKDLQEAFNTIGSPRSCALLEVATLEALSARGLGVFAALNADRLLQHYAKLSVEKWEPEFIERLMRLQLV